MASNGSFIVQCTLENAERGGRGHREKEGGGKEGGRGTEKRVKMKDILFVREAEKCMYTCKCSYLTCELFLRLLEVTPPEHSIPGDE